VGERLIRLDLLLDGVVEFEPVTEHRRVIVAHIRHIRRTLEPETTQYRLCLSPQFRVRVPGHCQVAHRLEGTARDQGSDVRVQEPVPGNGSQGAADVLLYEMVFAKVDQGYEAVDEAGDLR
jgi:hypothetical protein